MRRTKKYIFVYSSKDLIPIVHTNSNFQLDKDSRKFTSRSVFAFVERATIWRSIKQSFIIDFVIEVEYVATSKELRKRFDFMSS